MRTILLSVALLLGCKDKAKPVTEPDALLPGEVERVARENAAAAEKAAAPPVPFKPAQPWNGPGSCKTSVTGGATATQDDGQAAIQASWWFTDVDRSTYPMPNSITINCSGQKMQISISTVQSVAILGPKKYAVDKTKHELSLQGALDGMVFEISTGSLDITTFDQHGMSGTFEVAAKHGPGHHSIKIVGQFDYKCPYSACEP